MKKLLAQLGSNIFAVFLYSVCAFVVFTLIYILFSVLANLFGYCLALEGTENCEGFENPFVGGLVLGLVTGVLTFLGGIWVLIKNNFTYLSTLTKNRIGAEKHGRMILTFRKAMKLILWGLIIFFVVVLLFLFFLFFVIQSEV